MGGVQGLGWQGTCLERSIRPQAGRLGTCRLTVLGGRGADTPRGQGEGLAPIPPSRPGALCPRWPRGASHTFGPVSRVLLGLCPHGEELAFVCPVCCSGFALCLSSSVYSITCILLHPSVAIKTSFHLRTLKFLFCFVGLILLDDVSHFMLP